MSSAPYPHYRPTGSVWVDRVPSHWRVEKLKFVAHTQASNVDKHSHDGETPIRLCNYSDVYNRDRITADLPFMEATASMKEIEKFSLRAGDVIITKDSETWDDIAVPAYVPQDIGGVLCGYHLSQIRPQSTELDGAYLYYLLSCQSVNRQFQVSANGVTRFGLPSYYIENATILIPPLDEQRAIVRFLDAKMVQLDELIAKKEQLLELLTERREATVTDAVTRGLDPHAATKETENRSYPEIPRGWAVKRLKYVSDVIDCKHITPAYVNDGVPIVSTSEIKPFQISFSDARQVAEDDFCLMTELGRLPRENDVIYSRNVSLGSAARVQNDVRFCMGQDICLIRPTGIRSDFLEFQLNSLAVLRQIDEIMLGTTFKRMNVEEIKNFWVAVPPEPSQREIVENLTRRVSKIDQVSAAVTRAVSTLSEYRSALITSAVTGQINQRACDMKSAAQ